MRFDEWAEEWLRTTLHLEPKTLAGYESILRSRLLPRFATTRVDAITQLDVRRFVAELVDAGDAPGTVRNTFNVLRLVVATAAGSGALPTNPCTGVRLPRSRRQEMLFLEPPQLLMLADAITPRYRALVLVAGYTGLRAGELGALRVGRIDLIRRTVAVHESLADVKGELVFGPTKTHASRTVALPPFLCRTVGEHLVEHPPFADGLVFTSPTGLPLRHNLFYARHFKPAVARAGLSSALRFHDLRHTCAAMLIAQGAHPRAMMERLGHSSIEVTLDRYGHLFPSLDAALVDGLEETYRTSLRERRWPGRPSRFRSSPISGTSRRPTMPRSSSEPGR
jgi:integrase